MRGWFLRLTNETVIRIDGHDVRVYGKHAPVASGIAKALESFLPSKGWIAIHDRRVAVFGEIREHAQPIRNVLNAEFDL